MDGWRDGGTEGPYGTQDVERGKEGGEGSGNLCLKARAVWWQISAQRMVISDGLFIQGLQTRPRTSLSLLGLRGPPTTQPNSSHSTLAPISSCPIPSDAQPNPTQSRQNHARRRLRPEQPAPNPKPWKHERMVCLQLNRWTSKCRCITERLQGAVGRWSGSQQSWDPIYQVLTFKASKLNRTPSTCESWHSKYLSCRITVCWPTHAHSERRQIIFIVSKHPFQWQIILVMHARTKPSVCSSPPFSREWGQWRIYISKPPRHSSPPLENNLLREPSFFLSVFFCFLGELLSELVKSCVAGRGRPPKKKSPQR